MWVWTHIHTHTSQIWHHRLNRFHEDLFSFYRDSKPGKLWERVRGNSLQEKPGTRVTFQHNLHVCRHPACMAEQRPINHLSAVVVSQGYFEASARDIHQLWLKAGTSMSNVQTSEGQEENRKWGWRCEHVWREAESWRERKRWLERGRKEEWRVVRLGMFDHRRNIIAGEKVTFKLL